MVVRRVSSEPLLTSPPASSSSSHSPSSSVALVSPEPEASHHYSLDGLAKMWDDNEIVRGRLREQQNLCRHWDIKNSKEMDVSVDATLANCRINDSVLGPILKFIHANGGKMPSIDRVIEQVTLLYKMAKVSATGEKMYQEGWAVRRLCSHMKRLIHKQYQPKDRFCFLDRCLNLIRCIFKK